MRKREINSPVALALRAAGYKPVPRWWATQEQLDLIEFMLRENADEVNRIRANARSVDSDVDRAWAMHRAGE